MIPKESLAGTMRRPIVRLAAGAAIAASAWAAAAVTLPAQGGPPSAAAPAREAWTAPRTPWGDPDLQGIWPSTLMLGTPLERPESFGERATLNDVEFDARVEQSRRRRETDLERYLDPETARRNSSTGPPAHWGERGTPSRQASLIVDPPDGRLPPLTPAGTSRRDAIQSTYFYDFPGLVEAHAFERFEDLGPYDRCITRGLLASMLPTGYNMGTRIVQLPGFVVILNEMIHEARVVPLDGRPHLGDRIAQYMGDPRGRWDGDTLVVESRNFNARVGLTLNGNATPTSRSLRIEERFTRVDAETIRYEATIDDPETWTRPWTVSLPLTRQPDYGMYEYACHEGNYGMRHILSGARSDEEAGPQP
jgi:hypothetical protein